MRLLLILGPPAVGKMTVGRAVAARSSYRLFHNHHTIELLLDVFDYGTPAFSRLNGEFRQRVVEEAAASGTDLIFTVVMSMDLMEDAEFLERFAAPYDAAGGSPWSSWSPDSTPGWPATGPNTGWPRSGPSATSTGRTPTSARWKPSTG